MIYWTKQRTDKTSQMTELALSNTTHAAPKIVSLVGYELMYCD